MTATLTETLTGKQQQVNVKVQSMTAAISLLGNSVSALNLNGGETQVEVIAKDNKGNVISGQKYSSHCQPLLQVRALHWLQVAVRLLMIQVRLYLL
ncbi:hypothetical protein PKHYL_32890 [Psychrobacter sp. KH172YL61]|uniref:hypothetical protein n=1 Tax=Psychrobacter sp. KH172YL61 TaxID=2517899 RepID=UPI0010BAF394|nr:hypothetical protein [Psychrobacter sp. KH172YL61]BBI69098.1 hypothetical protein PKHYL_32890 [Psychrobacter sp. KH172YL61]